MEIVTRWNGPDKRYVIAVYPAQWTWNDFSAFKIEIDDMIRSVPYEVGAIADIRLASLLPQNATQNISKAFSSAPPNMGLVINVGAHPLSVLVVNIVRRIAPRSPARNIVFTNTMEEAFALMDERYPAHDQALPPS